MRRVKKNICLEGTIRITARGMGYVSTEEHDDEIEIDSTLLNTALHGDRVLVCVANNKSITKQGRVEKIILRARNEFVGTIMHNDKKIFLDPQDQKLYAKIEIPHAHLREANEGDKVIVRITKWTHPLENPIGEVRQIIGKAGVHETEMQAIVFDKGFSISFKPDVEEEAQTLKKKYRDLLAQEKKVRRNFVNTVTFTIDPVDAKDFDDALSIKKLPNGNFEIGIHIADVSFFVEEGSLLDREAAQRTTSIYLVDRTIPMLPEILSNDLCSLNPSEEKLTFSAVFEMTPEGVVKERWFGRTIIKSQKRFTYEEAALVLSTGNGIFFTELDALSNMGKKLRRERFEKGAIDFDQEEIRFVLDQNRKPMQIIKKERLETNRLIEDFMILANSEVAHYAEKNEEKIGETFVYRVHELPREERLKELVRLLRTLGYSVRSKHLPTDSQEISALLKKVDHVEHKSIVHLATIQAMEKAIYSTKNIGHFGLSLKHYTHFTSPIRRYPDILVHRFLGELLSGKKIPAKKLMDYEALTRYVSEMERFAQEAEWASIKYKQTEYMKERIGQTYEGIITGMNEGGMFVREDTTLSEGMIRLRDMKDDYYVFNKEARSLVGRSTKQKYTLGDRIKFKVLRVDVNKRFIDYVRV